MSKSDLVKTIQKKGTDLNKESVALQKEFKKGKLSNDDYKEFIEAYGLKRREYHQVQF